MGAYFDYGMIWLVGMSFTFMALTLKTHPYKLEQSIFLTMVGVVWFVTVPLMMVSERSRSYILERINGT